MAKPSKAMGDETPVRASSLPRGTIFTGAKTIVPKAAPKKAPAMPKRKQKKMLKGLSRNYS